MFKFIKKIFVSKLMYFGSLSSVNPLECVSMKNQECKTRPKIADINSNNPIFYPILPLVLKQINVAAIVIILMILCKNLCS